MTRCGTGSIRSDSACGTLDIPRNGVCGAALATIKICRVGQGVWTFADSKSRNESIAYVVDGPERRIPGI
jgi:hypothetical protein